MNFVKRWLGITVTQPIAIADDGSDELEIVLLRLEANVKRAREIFERRAKEGTNGRG